MGFRWSLSAMAVAAWVAVASTQARAATVFVTTLSGASELPAAIHTPYSVNLASHEAVDQPGPAVHPPDGELRLLAGEGNLSGNWGSDDEDTPPAGELVDSPLDGELYFNLRSLDFGNGELRGQLQPLDVASEPGNGTAIPLPPALVGGLVGLGAAGCAAAWVARRRRARAAL